jgi:hypothetical protein
VESCTVAELDLRGKGQRRVPAGSFVWWRKVLPLASSEVRQRAHGLDEERE